MDGEPAVPCEPSQRAFDHPAMAAQSVRRLDLTAPDPVLDVAIATCITAIPIVVTTAPCSFSDRWRGRPRRPVPSGGIGSSVGANSMESCAESCTLSAVSASASGMPCCSTTTCCFEPGLPFSVGFGPVVRLPLLPKHCASLERPASNQLYPLRPVARATPMEATFAATCAPAPPARTTPRAARPA